MDVHIFIYSSKSNNVEICQNNRSLNQSYYDLPVARAIIFKATNNLRYRIRSILSEIFLFYIVCILTNLIKFICILIEII